MEAVVTQASRPDLVDLRTLTTLWRIRLDSEQLPIIPGRWGHVSAHDLKTLCVYIAGSRHVRALLRRLPSGWRRHQVGDNEANLLAPLQDLDMACQEVRARRRPVLSPEHRAQLSARAQAMTRFRTRTGGSGPPDGLREGLGPENHSGDAK